MEFQQIARENDDFRSTLLSANIVMGAKVRSLSQLARENIYSLIRSHDNFELDNNPHPEHDLGVMIPTNKTGLFSKQH